MSPSSLREENREETSLRADLEKNTHSLIRLYLKLIDINNPETLSINHRVCIIVFATLRQRHRCNVAKFLPALQGKKGIPSHFRKLSPISIFSMSGCNVAILYLQHHIFNRLADPSQTHITLELHELSHKPSHRFSNHKVTTITNPSVIQSLFFKFFHKQKYKWKRSRSQLLTI